MSPLKLSKLLKEIPIIDKKLNIEEIIQVQNELTRNSMLKTSSDSRQKITSIENLLIRPENPMIRDKLWNNKEDITNFSTEGELEYE